MLFSTRTVPGVGGGRGARERDRQGIGPRGRGDDVGVAARVVGREGAALEGEDRLARGPGSNGRRHGGALVPDQEASRGRREPLLQEGRQRAPRRGLPPPPRPARRGGRRRDAATSPGTGSRRWPRPPSAAGRRRGARASLRDDAGVSARSDARRDAARSRRAATRSSARASTGSPTANGPMNAGPRRSRAPPRRRSGGSRAPSPRGRRSGSPRPGTPRRRGSRQGVEDAAARGVVRLVEVEAHRALLEHGRELDDAGGVDPQAGRASPASPRRAGPWRSRCRSGSWTGRSR